MVEKIKGVPTFKQREYIIAENNAHDELIKNGFSDGWNGFFRHMNNNKQYCYFVEL